MKHFFHALLGATLIGMPLLVSAQTMVSPTAGPPPASKKLERSIAKSTEGLNFDPALAPFYHGVASGDPTPTRVVIWTRRTPGDDATQYLLGWQVATDLNFANVVRQGQVNATAAADFTAKVDVGQLQPETTYYYRFYDYASEAVSIAGRTRTAPAGSTDHLRFAVVSCNNYQAGYYNAFRKISERADLDAVIHLGDYIYEYGAGEGTYGYSPDRPDRSNVPPIEIITLADYRTRYSLYRLDADLRAAHQQHPFITVWDDHESTNDAYKDGAQNHNEGEGDWETRKAISKQVYYEWMPIRDLPANRLYRQLRYGDLADLIMIDTRLEGREEQPLLASDTLEYRTILGQEQLQWLRTRVNQSQAQWKIIGNQVIFSPFNVGFAAENPTSLEEITLLESIFVDIWDGYPKERRVLLNDLRDNPNSDNVVILTGDFHCSFAFDVPSNPVVYPNPLALNFPTPSPSYNPVTGEGSLAVEFATPSISSANFDENVTFETALTFQTVINANLPIGPPLGFVNYNPHMKYVDLIQHGYMLLDLTPAAAQADWYYVNILDPADNNETYGAGRLTLNGQNRLTNATGPAAGKAVAPPLAPAMPQTGSNAFNMPLSEQADAAAVALNVFPVPAVVGGELYLLLALNEPSPIRIELLDMSGKVVRSFGESQRSGGTYTFTLPLENTMSPGFYLLRIAAAGNTITRKVMVE